MILINEKLQILYKIYLIIKSINKVLNKVLIIFNKYKMGWNIYTFSGF